MRPVDIPSIVPWLGSGVPLNFEGFSFYFEYFLLLAGSRMYIMSRLCLEFDIFIASVPSQRTTAHYHRNAKAELSFATLRTAHLHAGTSYTCSAYLERVRSHTQAASLSALFIMRYHFGHCAVRVVLHTYDVS